MHLNKETIESSGWKYTFQRVYKGKHEVRGARGRGVGALLFLLLLS